MTTHRTRLGRSDWAQQERICDKPRSVLTHLIENVFITVVTWRDDLRWTWHDEKNRTNKRDHGLSFETAQ